MLFQVTKDDGSLIARHATRDDADAVERLYTLLSPENRSISVQPDRLDLIANDPANLLLVVEWKGNVIGTALLTICLDAMFGTQPFGVVENIIVDTDYRSTGCGRFVSDAIDRAALNADSSKVMLLSNHMRSDAHAYFEAMGYDGEVKRGFVKYRSRLEAASVHSVLRPA